MWLHWGHLYIRPSWSGIPLHIRSLKCVSDKCRISSCLPWNDPLHNGQFSRTPLISKFFRIELSKQFGLPTCSLNTLIAILCWIPQCLMRDIWSGALWPHSGQMKGGDWGSSRANLSTKCLSVACLHKIEWFPNVALHPWIGHCSWISSGLGVWTGDAPGLI